MLRLIFAPLLALALGVGLASLCRKAWLAFILGMVVTYPLCVLLVYLGYHLEQALWPPDPGQVAYISIAISGEGYAVIYGAVYAGPVAAIVAGVVAVLVVALFRRMRPEDAGERTPPG